MKDNLNQILVNIADEYKENIDGDSRHYLEINIGRKAAELGFTEAGQRYKNTYAIVPLKSPVSGMRVRIDGRTFVNYVQFDSGVVVPGFVARQADLAHKMYVAQDSMVCNF